MELSHLFSHGRQPIPILNSMNTFTGYPRKCRRLWAAVFGLLAAGALLCHGQGIAFQFKDQSYTAIMGLPLSGSINMAKVEDQYDSDFYGDGTTYYDYYTDWCVHETNDAPTDVTISGSSISTSTVKVSWPANNYGSESFSITVPNSGGIGFDSTGTLTVDDYDPYYDPYYPTEDDPYDPTINDNPYYRWCFNVYCDPDYSPPNTATVTILNPNTVMSVSVDGSSELTESEDGETTYIQISRSDMFNNRTVYYTVGGTAIDGSDYGALWTGSVTLTGYESCVEIPVSTLNNIAYPKTLTVTLTANDLYKIGTKSATITFQPDPSNEPQDPDDPFMGDAQIFNGTPLSLIGSTIGSTKGTLTSGTAANGMTNSGAAFLDVLAASPYATSQRPGAFTITRNGGESAFTVNYTITGTAVAGSNYTALPSALTFAAKQTSTNLQVKMLTNSTLATAQTVVLSLSPGSAYFTGVNTQAVVTLVPSSALTNSVTSPNGRYWRGNGADPTYWSQVIPLDYETGTIYSNLNGNCPTLYSGLASWSSQTLYHYNATNSLAQTNITNRIAFNNPIVAFGERTGGTPLYLSQPYNFGIYAGDPLLSVTQIVVQVYYRTNDKLAGTIAIAPPNYANTNSMNRYATNGFQLTTSGFGLSTTLSDSPDLTWGAASLGAYVLTHAASSQATNYYYLVAACGYPAEGGNAMVINSSKGAALSLLYTLEFEARPPWRSIFLDRPQFAGVPLPPFYAGQSVAEILTNTPPVTNAVNFAPSSATNLDDSPELRRHPILDNFVASMGNDPMALANYVVNNIDLTDPMDYSDNGNVAEQAINPGGVSRGALGTFMEKEGSAADQCALLVYLLRQAGIPAVYEFAPRNGVQMLDTRLSALLRFQIQNAVNEAGQPYTTNTMIAVNYPWVAAYIGTNWVHIFPWLKDYQITEGYDLYEYMPTNYSSAYPWVRDYIHGKTNLTSLAANGDNTPRVIFPAFLKQTLLQNHPGVSVDDIGVQIINRPHLYARWQDFPTPTWVTNVSTPLESLTSSGVTNISPSLTNIFDTVSVEIYSVTNPVEDIQTGDLRLVDLHNRQFYIQQSLTNGNKVALNLILMPFRTNITTQFAYTNDTNLLSREVLSMTLGTNDNQLSVRFRYHRHRALTSAYPITPGLSFLGYTASEEVDIERPLLKGDQAAICMDYGRVTQDMLDTHASDIWQMEDALQKNHSNGVSPDVYEGAVMYLAGMSYYKKASDFSRVNQNLHKVSILSSWAVGLSKISAARDGFGNLTNGVDPGLPNVDMFFYEMACAGNGTTQPDVAEASDLAQQNFNLMSILDNSAEEHQIINRFYQQTNAVSTVRLLQLSQSRGAPIVPLTFSNYAAQGKIVQQGQALQNWDTALWSQVVSTLKSSPYAIAYITPGPATNSSYAGMAALVLGWNQWQALITPQSLNGGIGEAFAPGTVSAGNAINYDCEDSDDYEMSLTPPAADTTIAPSTTSAMEYSNTLAQIQSAGYILSGFDTNLSAAIAATMGSSTSGSQSQNYAQAFQTELQQGWLGEVWDGVSQTYAQASDPVQVISGEFYVDDTDLQLPGPLPLALRRNYSSQNLADNQLGTGWKLNIMPYLSVASGSTNIYAAEMDGSVLDYVQTSTNENVWVPTLTANPSLNNNTTAGVGGLANRLNNRIVETVNGSTNQYTLYGADGSQRVYQVSTFNNGILNQTRPWLQTWTDNRGNFYTFTYGTDSTQPNFGQMIRIQSSDGDYLGFDYDVNGHIIDAYSGDGRRLTYSYDDYADLTSVTLPDNTTRSYIYQHAAQAVTNGTATNSTHLIIEVDKPEGRVLQISYDAQRRVTNQLSTAGANLTPIRTATFAYSNNFSLSKSATNAITGHTLVVDGNGQTNRYDYSNSLITQVTDPLNRVVRQIWYPDMTNAPGYPRSLSQRVNKRGLTTRYLYDSQGNVTNTTVTGDLTGNGVTGTTAVTTAIYSNNLPIQIVGPTGTTNLFSYTNTWLVARQDAWPSGGTAPITSLYSYTTVSNTGDGTISFGLLWQEIRAANSPDAATNQYTYSSQGLPTQITRYTGTTDPAVVMSNFYNNLGELEVKTDAAGRSVVFGYDPMGRLESREIYEAGQSAPMSWDYTYYDENGEVNWLEGPRYNPEDYIWRDYDGAGRLAQEIHWRSMAKADGSGVAAETGSALYATTFNLYDPVGNLTQTVDPLQNYALMNYDGDGELLCKRSYNAAGGLLKTEGYSYEPGGKVAMHTNALGGIAYSYYTSNGLPRMTIGPDGSTNQWLYDLAGRVVEEILPNGACWQTIYNDASRTATRTLVNAGINATEIRQFDRRGNLIQFTDADGNVFNSTFDGLDRLKTSTGPATISGASAQQSTMRVYDNCGKVQTVINGLGEQTITTFDAAQRPISVQIKDAAGNTVRQTVYTYSPDGNSVTVTSGTTNPVVTTIFTDAANKTVLTLRSPQSGVQDSTLSVYDANENLLSTTESDGQTTFSTCAYAYDGLNRIIRQTRNGDEVTSFAYNGAGSITNRVMPGPLTWSAVYDLANRKTHEQLCGTNNVAQRVFNYQFYTSGANVGLLQCVTNPLGTVLSYGYDGLRRVTSVTTSGAGSQNGSTSCAYDNLGRALLISHSATNQSSTAISRVFDGYGQILDEQVSIDGVLSREVAQQWDADGHRVQMNGEPVFAQQQGYGRSASYGYRADGLLTNVNVGGASYTYNYGDDGLLSSRVNPFRTQTISQRDGAGRILSESSSVGGATPFAETLVWSTDGRLTNYSVARPDYGTDARNYAYNFNQVNRLETEALALKPGDPAATFAYTYDFGRTNGPGVLTENKTSGGSYTNDWSVAADATGLDPILRLTTENEAYLARRFVVGSNNAPSNTAYVSVSLDGRVMKNADFNPASGRWRMLLEMPSEGTNGTAHTVVASAIHPLGFALGSVTNAYRVSSKDRTTNTFDAFGNETSRLLVNRSNALVRLQTLTWDGLGRLVNVMERDAVQDGYNWAATYDGLGRRLRTVYTPVQSNSPNTSLALTLDSWFDPQVGFLEIAVAINEQRTWKIYGPDISQGFALQGCGGLEATIREYDGYAVGVINDCFGNGVAVVSNNVAVFGTTRVGAYGPVAGSTAPLLSKNVSLAAATIFRGGRMDPMGLFCFGHRYYDANSGRFISPDPLGHAASIGLYDYCGGDPIDHFDPDGRCIEGTIAGWNSAPVPANASSAFMAGYYGGGVTSGFAEGWNGGSQIVDNTLTFGATDALGLTDTSQLQGSEYTDSLILANVARSSLLTAATFGTAALAQGGSQAALYGYQGLQIYNAGSSGYSIGTGINQVANGNNWGYLNIAGGTLGVVGSTTFAAGNPTLNSLAGVGPSSGGFAQSAVTWWNTGSEGDAAFQNLSFGQQLQSEIGQNAVSGTSTSGTYAQIGGDSATALQKGANILQSGNPMNIFGLNLPQTFNLLGTGPTAGVRLYVPPAAFIGAGAINAVNTATSP
jgi:RHS repeat-associated protein